MGTCYKLHSIVVVCYQSHVPVFGQIQDIISVGDKFYLVLQLLKAVIFSQHFHAYQVIPTSLQHVHVCELSSLADYHPLCLYQSFDPRLCNTYFVPFKYYVLSEVD